MQHRVRSEIDTHPVTGPDGLGLLERCSARFARLLDDLGAATDPRWARPSTCPGWSLRDLVNHVVGGAVRYRMLLDGAAGTELAATRAVDHVGPDPRSAFDRSARELATAFAAAFATGPEPCVDHPLGRRSVADLLTMRLLEVTLHGWDVATSTGRPFPVDADAERVLSDPRSRRVVAELRAAGLYADPQSAGHPLLGFTGRGTPRLR